MSPLIGDTQSSPQRRERGMAVVRDWEREAMGTECFMDIDVYKWKGVPAMDGGDDYPTT